MKDSARYDLIQAFNQCSWEMAAILYAILDF